MAHYHWPNVAITLSSYFAYFEQSRPISHSLHKNYSFWIYHVYYSSFSLSLSFFSFVLLQLRSSCSCWDLFHLWSLHFELVCDSNLFPFRWFRTCFVMHSMRFCMIFKNTCFTFASICWKNLCNITTIYMNNLGNDSFDPKSRSNRTRILFVLGTTLTELNNRTKTSHPTRSFKGLIS